MAVVIERLVLETWLQIKALEMSDSEDWLQRFGVQPHRDIYIPDSEETRQQSLRHQLSYTTCIKLNSFCTSNPGDITTLTHI